MFVQLRREAPGLVGGGVRRAPALLLVLPLFTSLWTKNRGLSLDYEFLRKKLHEPYIYIYIYIYIFICHFSGKA